MPNLTGNTTTIDKIAETKDPIETGVVLYGSSTGTETTKMKLYNIFEKTAFMKLKTTAKNIIDAINELKDRTDKLNTDKADIENVADKIDWGTSTHAYAYRVGKIVFFRARCTAKAANQLNFASIKDTSISPNGFFPLQSHLPGSGDIGKRSFAAIGLNGVNIITATVYENYSSSKMVAPVGDVEVYGWWPIK